jgi:hypothetical protein
VILLERTKVARHRQKGKGLEIRCRANLLPLKAMHYAIAYAKHRVCKQRNSNAVLYIPRLTAQMRDLSTIINALDSYGRPPDRLPTSEPGIGAVEDPEIRANAIRSSVKAYVDLFYMVKASERKSYMESIQRESKFGMSPGRNLLLIPALLAELNQPKEELSIGLFNSIYKMPFNVLYECSKSALHVENLLRNMAIKNMQFEIMEHFSKSLGRVEARMKAIERGVIKPSEDEKLKVEFIDKPLEFSKITQINIADLTEQRVLTQAAMYGRLYRMIRRVSIA